MARAIPLVLLAMFVPGCSCDGPRRPQHDADLDSGDGSGSQPFRDAWQVIHEGRFDVLDDDGNPAITRLTIGNGLGFQGNFINRGDVIVLFDGPPDTIKVELRRFTFAVDDEDATEDFERLQVWAYNAKLGTPARPEEMDERSRCGGSGQDGLPDPWLDDCGIYLYYDGQNQLARAGADIRVTLPPDYRQHLVVSTADNDTEDSYPNRGNVCVTGLDGTLDVELGSGLAYVALAPGATPAPECPAELRAECDASGWPIGCGCIAQGYEFGHVAIESRAPSPSTMTVDVPPVLWTLVRADNDGINELGGKHCTASLALPGDIEWLDDDPQQPWKRAAQVNRPAAAPATGYGVTLASHGCEPVAAVESPDDWIEDDDDPPSELRGNLTVCAGCLAGKSCADLLPD